MPIIRDFLNRGSVNEASSQVNSSRRVGKKINLLDKKLDSLYKDIYISRPDNKQNLDNILNQLDSSLDNLQSDEISISGMSELMRRINKDSGSEDVNSLMKNVGELFNDQTLINALFMNDDVHRYISGQNYQYDMICKYLPKVLDALEIKRDNVLSSDNFSKDFINPKSPKSNKEEVEKFSSNVKKIEKIYEISKFLDKTYMNMSKYGEDFIYIVPYNLAFERVIKRTNYRKNSARLGQVTFYENASLETKSNAEFVQCLNENYITSDEFKKFRESSLNASGEVVSEIKNFECGEINLHFNSTNVVKEFINERVVLHNAQEMEAFQSLFSIFESKNNVSSGNLSKEFEKVNAKNDKLSNISNDGLIIPENLDRDPNKIDKNMLGAVVERLPRENVIPIYIGKVCMGYYYLEFREEHNRCGFCGNSHTTSPGISNANNYAYRMSEDQHDLTIKFIASKLSAAIDTKFINANKDLKEEIYAILRYNEKFDISRSNDIGVTFIPAEDIVHCYFEFDENTHRGISDLQKSVVPAMLYILLYLTDIIGKVSRSTDKRIYYVKQNVETNVARTMMNVVQQIKKGNMGMRQIESMNNILNVVGKYNDYIIPLGQSGDPPITFEVMNGQDINTPTEIMEKMEEAAVNPIMPFEMVNSTYQQDFAIRFSMSNTRFLKSINTRQRDTQMIFSKIYTKIYNYEFGETNSFIEVILPPPLYLTMTNNQQLIDTISQQADKIIELELSNEEEEVKTEFKKVYTRGCLAAYIDFSQIERYKTLAKMNVEAAKIPQVEEHIDDDSGFDDFA